jgi:hypothetical protein
MLNLPARVIGPCFDRASGRFAAGVCGTGFFVRVASERVPNRWHGYIVTAHHVVSRAAEYSLEIANPAEPGSLYPRVRIPEWKQPIERVDLAVAPFVPPSGYEVTALQQGIQLIDQLPYEGLLGAPIFYVGLLEPLDRQVARSGTLAALNQSGVPHNAGDYEYGVHLADCRSYTGFSGSPCLVEYPAPKLTPEALPVPPPPNGGPIGRIIYLHMLCGMLTEHLDAYDDESRLEARSGIGILLPSEFIWQGLMTPALKAERRQADG